MKPIELSNVCNILQLIEYMANLHGDKKAFCLIDQEETVITYNQFYVDILQMVKAFETEYPDVKHVGISGTINYDWIKLFFGAICSGKVIVPIEKGIEEKQIGKLLKLADVQLFFGGVSANHEVTCMDINEAAIKLSSLNCKGEKAGHKIKSDDVAIIIFTSGTTGDSKGVMLTHENICLNCMFSAEVVHREEQEQERIIMILPPHHMFSITVNLLAPLLIGFEVYIGGELKYMTKYMRSYKPTTQVIVPVIADNMYKRVVTEGKKQGFDVGQILQSKDALMSLAVEERRKRFGTILDMFGGELHTIVSGGAHISEDAATFFNIIGVDFLNGYGITECSPVISCNRRNNNDIRTVGMVAGKRYCETKIEDGEILIKGRIVMKGYYNDKAATKLAIRDGWYHTGDLGKFDSSGKLIITGRNKNLIILRDGNNISPEELEGEIEKIESVSEVIVYVDDSGNSEVLGAMIFPNKELKTKIGEAAVKEMIKNQISNINNKWPVYKRIKVVNFRDSEFEKTSLGKVRRFRYLDSNNKFKI